MNSVISMHNTSTLKGRLQRANTPFPIISQLISIYKQHATDRPSILSQSDATVCLFLENFRCTSIGRSVATLSTIGIHPRCGAQRSRRASTQFRERTVNMAIIIISITIIINLSFFALLCLPCCVGMRQESLYILSRLATHACSRDVTIS